MNAMDLSEFGRTPQGVRGLKFLGVGIERSAISSHPARGAWIEIEVFPIL